MPGKLSEATIHGAVDSGCYIRIARICHGRIQINISPGVPKPFAQIKAELLANWYSADAADGVDVDVCEVCDNTRELVNGGRMCAPCAAINN